MDFKNTSVRVFDNVPLEDGTQVDVYVPPVNKTQPPNGYPVIFYVHGGAWHVGSKANSQKPCQILAEQGYVAVAASYSLSCVSNPQMEAILGIVVLVLLALALTSRTMTQMMLVFVLMVIVVMFFVVLWMFLPREHVQHPDHIMDVARAFKWTHDNISKFGGNPDGIFTMGHSAGGHLASLLSTNFHYLEDLGVNPRAIKGCISVSGVYSDKRMQQTRLGRQLLMNAFGHREHYYDAFPIYSITKDTPPFLLLNAGMDISLKRHTLDFHYALSQQGVFVETQYFQDRSHWNIMHGWEKSNRAVLEKITEFIQEVQDYEHDRILTASVKTSPLTSESSKQDS